MFAEERQSAMVSVSADTPQPTLLVCIHHAHLGGHVRARLPQYAPGDAQS
jgi:hypothetical protein